MSYSSLAFIILLCIITCFAKSSSLVHNQKKGRIFCLCLLAPLSFSMTNREQDMNQMDPFPLSLSLFLCFRLMAHFAWTQEKSENNLYTSKNNGLGLAARKRHPYFALEPKERPELLTKSANHMRKIHLLACKERLTGHLE